MKFSSQEEYGLRCLLRIAKNKSEDGMTIPEISSAERLSQANAGKLLRILRLGGFIESSRGSSGGYRLTRPPEEINIGEVLSVLGGKFFESSFCSDFTGNESICTHTIDCSIRSLWRAVQTAVDSILSKTTLADMLGKEEETASFVYALLEEEQQSLRNQQKPA